MLCNTNVCVNWQMLDWGQIYRCDLERFILPFVLFTYILYNVEMCVMLNNQLISDSVLLRKHVIFAKSAVLRMNNYGMDANKIPFFKKMNPGYLNN